MYFSSSSVFFEKNTHKQGRANKDSNIKVHYKFHSKNINVFSDFILLFVGILLYLMRFLGSFVIKSPFKASTINAKE